MTHEQDITALERSLGEARPTSRRTSGSGCATSSPAAAEAGLVDVAFERHDSPLGTLLVGATGEGLVRVGLPAEGEEAVLNSSPGASRPACWAPRAARSCLARHQLDEYFDPRAGGFEVPLDWRLAHGFRRDVLRATAQIPYGQHGLVPRRRDARRQRGAVRAAGSALAPTRCRSSCRATASCRPAAAWAPTAAAPTPRPSC